MLKLKTEEAMLLTEKQALISQLKKDLLQWQGIQLKSADVFPMGLGPLEEAFPNGIFPRGVIHEFVSFDRTGGAVSCGFISGLLGKMMLNGGICIWISCFHTLFPTGIRSFGVVPENVIFVQMEREKDVLWAMEEALKCEGITAVLAEIHQLDFVQSRRLQLAVEKSAVTGFILQHNPKQLGATACAARWKISSLPSQLEDGLPGIGYPSWDIELLKVRNGNPGRWQMTWTDSGFEPVIKANKAMEDWEQSYHNQGLA
ncbi:MAG: Error-prone repair protein ImuA [Sphingobacterium sp.]|nr:Error-prone repair protein ImuA [Sphingobacterium sp.]